ncbi:hypothetical protein [Nostoc sp. DedSLP04]|uniref:hypothetical protein n=1 Tax=Nostoc sp. DedSLP04 TaxID=3075401 RepID=UPI002AD4B338|nr:hypothetical protein [Nostoc sp. DedSLP04]MDZ8034092.1 hypothetical protein [Nostoc sp. DedSLP04]
MKIKPQSRRGQEGREKRKQKLFEVTIDSDRYSPVCCLSKLTKVSDNLKPASHQA